MEFLKNAVQDFWSSVVAGLQWIWIVYAVIVYLQVALNISTKVKPVGCETANRTNPSVSLRKTLRVARNLMKLSKLEEASEMLRKTLLTSANGVRSGYTSEDERRAMNRITSCLHELRSICLYQQGDVLGSMKEMDKCIGQADVINVNLLNSANWCFQLFHRWCSENSEHFQKDIVEYLLSKRNRLELEVQTKISGPNHLLEAIHCVILSELMVKCGILSQTDLSHTTQLCLSLYCLTKSEVTGPGGMAENEMSRFQQQ